MKKNSDFYRVVNAVINTLNQAARMVDHFSYDSHNYTLALDCMVTD